MLGILYRFNRDLATVKSFDEKTAAVVGKKTYRNNDPTMKNLDLLAEAVKIINVPLEIYYSCAIAKKLPRYERNDNSIIMFIKEQIPNIENTDIVFSLLKGFVYTERITAAELYYKIVREKSYLYRQYSTRYAVWMMNENLRNKLLKIKMEDRPNNDQLSEDNIIQFLEKWNANKEYIQSLQKFKDKKWLKDFIQQLYVHFLVKEKIEVIKDNKLYGGSRYHYEYITNKEHYLNMQ